MIAAAATEMPPVPLALIPSGREIEIVSLGLNQETSARLREFGIREGALARVVQHGGGQVILGLEEARIAVARDASLRVLVRERAG